MKKLMGWKMAGFLSGLALAILALNGALQAQEAGASITGRVMNPAGMAIKTGEVKMTSDKTSPPKERVYKYTFQIDSDGNYKGANIVPGDYLAVVFDGAKSLDFLPVTLRSGDAKTLDFDMSRAEYIKSMTPEEKAALEEYKKRNAAVNTDNEKIANINKTLIQAREDEKNGKAADAVKSLQGLTALKPEEAILWASLGEAQLLAGDTATKAARAAHTATNDPAIVQNYADAADSYKKAIQFNANAKKQVPENLAAYQLNLGQALAKSGNLKDAADSYEAAAKTSPAAAGTSYFNEAVVFFNAGNNDVAAVAADKAIAADPKKADAYYIKAQALIPKATADAKGNFVLPPGCLEAYQEYLELAPEGSHAAEVKELLVGLKQPVKNSFKAGKK